MGNQKFNLTNMIPNAWVYKLKHMNKTSKNTTYSMSSSMLKKNPLSPASAPLSSPLQLEPQCRSRKSYHITRELTTIDQLKITPPRITPPRKSSKSSSKSRKYTRSSTTTSSCSCQSTSTYTTSLSSRSKSRSPSSPPLPLKETNVVKTGDNLGFLVEDALLKIKAVRADDKQSILDHNAIANKKPQHFIHNTNLHLPPIITKQETQHHSKTIKNDKLKPHYIHKDHTNNSTSGRLSVSSPRGLRLKVNSPKIMGRKQGQNVSKNGGRKSTSLKKKSNIKESFAVVKSSFDPQRDFKESMVEMIVQNNLKATKDLEDLLTCYLSLNSVEYHDVIIKVFKQIWFDFRHPT